MIRSAGASLIEAITTLNHLNESLEHECEPEEDSTFPCEPESILVFNSVVESICACMGVVLECMGNARGANIGAHSKVGKLVSSDGATAVLHLGSGESLSFVWCPEQSFKMGSYDCPPTMGVAAKNEQILTKCDGFWIAATPIPQSFWQAVMAQNPSHHKGRDKPVEGITWFDAMLFTQILNLRTERPPNLRFALPTDMQWECACRHGSEANLTSNRNSECGIYTAYTARASDTNYAYLYSDASDALDEVAWYYHNSNTTTHEVGGKAPSPLGLYDMHGNVSEWCLDWEDGEEADEKYAKSLRGGSYMDYPSSCLAGSKGSCPPIESCRSVGMRLIINHTRSGQ
jgi:sulfatase modifying factor 1